MAEDNATNRLVIGKQLSHLGYAFEMAEDGEAAWQALREKSYGLLLSDCFMPILDGYELTARIRQAEAETGHHLPIVALTANALAGDAEKCLRSGMDDYLSKPVAIDRLASALAKWLPAARQDAAPAEETPAPPPLEEVPVDFAALAEILGTDDHEAFREVIGFFLECFDELEERIWTCLKGRDRPGLRNAAHAAKGAARNAGARRLAETLAELERRAQSARYTTLTALAEEMQAGQRAVRGFLADMSSTTQAPIGEDHG
ncbi:MAG: response regulator [Magnetospirillum sp.]|nr:response regulator [Magnetospirillum sp.]